MDAAAAIKDDAGSSADTGISIAKTATTAVDFSTFGCGAQTSSFCSRCVGVRPDTGETIKVWFCGRTCQAAEWKKHKPSCQQMQAISRLYRAGTFLQKVYYSVQTYAPVCKVGKVAKQGDKIHVWPSKSLDFRGQPFEEPTSDLTWTVQDKEAVLSSQADFSAVALVSELYHLLPNDLCSEPQYSLLSGPFFRARQRVVWLDDPSPHSSPYYLIVVLKLRTGGEYALDLAGAQHGQLKCIRPMKQYLEETNATIVDGGSLQSIKSFSQESLKSYQEPMAKAAGVGSLHMIYTDAKVSARKLADWERRNGQTMAQVIRTGNQGFEKLMKEITIFLDDSLKTFYTSTNMSNYDTSDYVELCQVVCPEITPEQAYAAASHVRQLTNDQVQEGALQALKTMGLSVDQAKANGRRELQQHLEKVKTMG